MGSPVSKLASDGHGSPRQSSHQLTFPCLFHVKGGQRSDEAHLLTSQNGGDADTILKAIRSGADEAGNSQMRDSSYLDAQIH